MHEQEMFSRRCMWRFLVLMVQIPLILLPFTAALATQHITLGNAVRTGDLTLVQGRLREITDQELDGASDRFTPLAVAAVRGDIEMVRLLLEAGADPNAPSLSGANALSMAVRSCRASLELIDHLVQAGADLENLSGVGITPLLFAVQEERTALALRLIESGADINTLNPFGEGVLSYAIYTRNNELIRKLIELHVDTEQLTRLFTTVDYDPPGMGTAQPHHRVVCGME